MYMPLTGQKLQEDQPLLSRTPRRLKAHPFQLDCPNSTQSLSNVVDQTFYQHIREIQKTYDTHFSQFEEKKETRQDIHNRRHQGENQIPERDQKHLGLKRNFFSKTSEINIFIALTKN